MDSTIAVLPPHVIDQIAAGEVIERPASVVKELVDNAIDAGARSIAIDCTAGGRTLVRVSDDGCGMSRRDAVLAFERHATSKLRGVDDLWTLATMGFRGEALPAIASVSRLALTTRRADDLAGTRVAFDGGAFIGVTDVGAPAGTTVEVADLLYNLPAREKFLKGEATEASHITDLVAKVAMAHPELHLRLRHNSRLALDLPPDRDGFARACALLGPRVAARLVPVVGEEAGIRVTAYLGAPELAQTTARGVQIFAGRRPIRDRGVLHALAMGYGELVPRGRYPVAVVLLDVPCGTVDINVHPQKHEVRFADPAAVHAAVRHVVQAGVAAAPWRAESGAGPIQMTAIASAAPPALPFDGHAATPLATSLARSYARELRTRGGGSQASFGFGLDTQPSARPLAPRDWVEAIRARTNRDREPAAWPLGSVHGMRSPIAREGHRRDDDAPRDDTRHDGARHDDARHDDARSNDGRRDDGRRDDARRDDARRDDARRDDARDDARRDDARDDARRDDARGDARRDDACRDDIHREGTAHDGVLPDETHRGETHRADSPFAGTHRADTHPADTHRIDVQRRDAARDDSDRGDNRRDDGHRDDGHRDDGHRDDGHRDDGHRDDAHRGDAHGESAEGGPGHGTHGHRYDARHAAAVRDQPFAAGSGPVASRGYFAHLRYLGQLDLTYLVCEAGGELVLVDQHAAHERVELARLRTRHTAREVPIQKLLFPATLEATPEQLELVARVGALLAEVGFEVEPFGRTTLALKSVPAGIRHGDPAHLLRDLLEDWARDGAPSDEERLANALARIACHSVVRAGDRLATSEAESLLRALDGIDPATPHGAPHGRALLLRLPLAEIGRRFGR